MTSMAPVYIIDILGSSLTIVLCFFAFSIMRKAYRARREFGLYTYLYIQTIALCIFAVSRSAGHIIKHVLVSMDKGAAWKLLAPVSGSINSFTFIIFGLAAVMYSNIRAASERMEALEKRRLDLKEAKESVERSLGEKSVLLEEVHHRVKNNMAVISSLLDMQARITENKQFRQVLKECNQRVKSMALVHEKLYRTRDFTRISIRDYMEELVSDLMNSYGYSHIKPTINVPDLGLGLDILIPLGLIINEVVSNSLKYAFKDIENPALEIVLTEKDGKVELTLADNGPGLPDGASHVGGKTLGLSIINALTGQLDGDMEVSSGDGARYTITFPVKEGSD